VFASVPKKGTPTPVHGEAMWQVARFSLRDRC